ncbi:MAG: ROK family protein [Planctomycetia bacterium]|nr:ROK family protein [Planctomycetia bacterium]
MAHSRQFISLAEARPPFFVGVDVGGTNIKIGVVDDLGRPLSWTSIHTEVEKGPGAGIARMQQAIQQVIAQTGLNVGAIARIGLGTPGTMDIAKGILLSPGNLPGWWNFPIRDRLSEAAGLPVTYSNDAGAAAYGEFWVGSGRVLHSMVMFTLGTGVGGGIIIGDLHVEGENSAGSELGHMIIDYHDTARLCSCGQRGHLEAYASAPSVVKRTEELLQEGRKSSLQARIAAGQELSSLVIDEEAERGDELSLEIVLETARYLGIGIVTAMHAIDPHGVVIGGAMTFGQHETQTGRKFLQRVKQEVCQRAFPILAQRTTIDYASLGGDAGYIGAAGLARLAYSRKS